MLPPARGSSGSPRAARRALYGHDLARIQHEGFADFAREVAPGLLDALHGAGIREGLVVDLGCGDGGWLRELDRAGFRALGVERSPALARIARTRATRARVRVASLYEVPLPPCDAVTALGEVLSYLPASGAGGGGRRGGASASLPRLLRRVAGALRPGGLFAFDLLVASRGRPMAYRTWRAGRDWAVLTEVSETPSRGRLERDITTFLRTGSGYRRRRERHVVRVVARDDVTRWLREAGFRVRASRRYGAFELPPRRLAFLARKR